MSVWEHLGPMLDPQDLALVLNTWHCLLYTVCFLSVCSHCVLHIVCYMLITHSLPSGPYCGTSCLFSPIMSVLPYTDWLLLGDLQSNVFLCSLSPTHNLHTCLVLHMQACIHCVQIYTHGTMQGEHAHEDTLCNMHTCTLTSHNTQHTHTSHTYHIYTIGYTTHTNYRPDIHIISLRYTQTCPHIWTWFTLMSWSQTDSESWDPTTGSEVSLGHPGVQIVLDPLPWSPISRCWLYLWIIWTRSL